MPLQASVRGMICRKHLDFQLHEADTEVEAICQTDAAIKIQALYRGYRVRKMNKAKTCDKKLNVKKQVTFGISLSCDSFFSFSNFCLPLKLALIIAKVSSDFSL
jgi:hypothetical protein